MERLDNIIYFQESGVEPNRTVPYRPLNVLFLTSVRDTGTCDRNGAFVETGQGLGYMEGVIERTIIETYPLSGKLHGLIRVVGVITDDMEKDMKGSTYGVLPEIGRDWIYPSSLITPDRTRMWDLTYNISSSFRALPKTATEDRAQLKLEFETKVLEMMRELKADVLVSDHYMARIDHLSNGWGLFGRVLNIHPALTLEGHPFSFRGKTPTADAIERARTGAETWTGATLHIINETIDAGPAIAYTASTPVYSTDESQWLRYRNYRVSKLPVFIHGLAHYAISIEPVLNEIDFKNLRPRERVLAR